jgi:hypothetical protein
VVQVPAEEKEGELVPEPTGEREKVLKPEGKAFAQKL